MKLGIDLKLTTFLKQSWKNASRFAWCLLMNPPMDSWKSFFFKQYSFDEVIDISVAFLVSRSYLRASSTSACSPMTAPVVVAVR